MMGAIDKIFRGISKAGGFLGGLFLTAAMLLLMSNIFGRMTNTVIPGSYELFEMMMVVPVSFALFYAGVLKYHVVVDLVVSRFPRRFAAVAETVTAALSFSIWALVAWSNIRVACENGLREMTEILELPYLPFRLVWIFFLICFCLVCLLDAVRALGRVIKQ